MEWIFFGIAIIGVAVLVWSSINDRKMCRENRREEEEHYEERESRI